MIFCVFRSKYQRQQHKNATDSGNTIRICRTKRFKREKLTLFTLNPCDGVALTHMRARLHADIDQFAA